MTVGDQLSATRRAEIEEAFGERRLAALARWRGSLVDEPAAGELPALERWRPRTLARFRFALLEHLAAKGACSLRDLESNPPEVLALPLDRGELVVIVESARRHGLIARLDPGAGSGPVSEGDEWVVTDAGRRVLRRGAAWLLPHVGRISGAALTVIAAVLTILGTKLSVEGGFWSIFAVIVAGLVVVALTGGFVAWLRARRIGAGAAKGAVAEDWTRWAAAFPDVYETATRPFPRRWLLVAATAIAIGIAAPFWLPGDGFWVEAVLYVGILGGWLVFLVTVGDWLTRWSDIQAELRRRRIVSILTLKEE